MGSSESKRDASNSDSEENPRESEKRTPWEPTRWSRVLMAQETGSAEGQAALADLCEIYRKPICDFINYCGHQDAEDLTQDFFVWFLSKEHLKAVDRARGKFRTFLLGYLKNFLRNEYQKAKRQKRGGDRVIVSFEAEETDAQVQSEARNEPNQEEWYGIRWAARVIQLAIEAVENYYADKGDRELFDAIKLYLIQNSEDSPYSQIAGRLGFRENAIKAAVHRLRKKFQSEIRKKIADTVSPAEVEEEYWYLFNLVERWPDIQLQAW